MTQIICKNLSLGYDGNLIASNINFTVNRGDYICVVGENGSGKTTLIKTLLNINHPIEGEIQFSENTSFSDIGYMPQQSNIQKDFPASVVEIVYSGCHKGHSFLSGRKYNMKTVNHNLKRMGIEHLASESFRNLSGGQQQRVFLARALCAAKNIVVLDEPVSGLDPKITAELYSVLKKLNQDEKMTIIMVSHDINAALSNATHILHIGQDCSFYGSVDEYKKNKLMNILPPGGAQYE